MTPFTPYTFGTMSLGRNPADVVQDLVVARRAMEAGVWFHSSPTYNQGFTFMVLRLAFDENRSRVPRMVIKVRDGSVALMRFEVEDSCRRLGLEGIDVAQLTANLKARHDIIIDGGYGKLKGKTFRLSNMGDETVETITALIAALDDSLPA